MRFYTIYRIIVLGCLLPFIGQADSLVAARPKSCNQLFKETYALLEKGHHPYLMDPAQCRTAHKLLVWLWLVKHDKEATLKDYSDFMGENKHWPSMNKIQEGAENTIRFATKPKEVLAFFKHRKPKTSQGMIHYVRALFASNQNTQAVKALKEFWWNRNFTANNETFFYDNYKKHLTSEDHQKRMDRLAIEGNYYGLKRMLPRVSKKAHGVIQTNLAFIQDHPGASFHLQKLTDVERNNIGVLYQRLKWRLKKGKKDDAVTLFMASHKQGHIQSFMPQWFHSRHYCARILFRQKNYKDAYAVLKSHGLNPKETDELSDYATAEWFLGWLSLRFLKKPSDAAVHFKNMLTHVQTPISRAKASYWLGRTMMVLGNKEKAKAWYQQAGQFSHVFYGQQALKELGHKVSFNLKDKPSDLELHWEERELQAAAKLLYTTNPNDIHLRSFLVHMARHSKPGHEEHFMHWMHENGLKKWMVLCAKIAGRKGPILLKSSFPKHVFEPHVLKHPHLSEVFLHSLIRQESGFDPAIKSPAGACGMMQVMPRVAQNLCKQLKLPYVEHKLTQDPHYNIRVGSFFLNGLTEKFRGNKILALAAYNAGERPVKEWLKDYGDLRDGTLDVLDWIESIPFSETRTYVMRILESMVIYESMLGIG
jgi:soluble lytic murein transglycosylase